MIEELFAYAVLAKTGLLPQETGQKEPFKALCYADDCLSWGDEKQTRELYEKAFQYYSKP